MHDERGISRVPNRCKDLIAFGRANQGTRYLECLACFSERQDFDTGVDVAARYDLDLLLAALVRTPGPSGADVPSEEGS